jgi:hypothetical protein
VTIIEEMGAVPDLQHDHAPSREKSRSPLTAEIAAWQHPNRSNLQRVFPKDMKAKTFIQCSVDRLPVPACLWQAHGMSRFADVSVSGRTIG